MKHVAGTVVTVVLLAGVADARQTAPAQPPEKPIVEDYASFAVGPLPDGLPYDRSFYKKYVDGHGIPVIASEKVPDAALLMARDIVIFMLAGRTDIRKEMVARGYRVGVMAQTEMTTDLPEQQDRKRPAKDDPRLTRSERENYDTPTGIGGQTDKDYWNRRARGLGGVYTTCAEENVLGYPNTRYYGEHILVHEWSHGVMGATRTADPALYGEIQAAYKQAMARGQVQGALRRDHRERGTGRKGRSGGSGRTMNGWTVRRASRRRTT